MTDLFLTNYLTNKEIMILRGYISCSRSQSEFIAKFGLEPRSSDSKTHVLN